MVRILSPFRSYGGRDCFAVSVVRVLVGLVLLAACQRAVTPSPQPTSIQVGQATQAGPATITPTRQEPSLTPTQTASPTGPAYAMSAGTRAPSPTITPSITPDPFACLPRRAPDETAQVQWVTDGDTIVVALPDGLKSVRYLGIDAPAYLPNIRFYGPPAYQHNRKLVEGQVVSLYRDGPDKDALGQLLRYVVAQGVLVNLELVRLGFARASPPSEVGPTTPGTTLVCTENLRQAEQAAQTAQIGLWGEMMVGSARTAQATLSATAPRPTGTSPSATTALPSATPRIQVTAPIPATATLTLAASLTPGPTTTGMPPTPTNTLAPTPTRTGAPPTATNTVSPTQSTATNIFISDLLYEGTASLEERDEHVEIVNEGSTPVVMTDWQLVKKGADISFTFPDFTLQPGVSCYIYTNQVDAYSCVNDSFRYSYGIWDSDGGCAQLFDANNTLQDEYCYDGLD